MEFTYRRECSRDFRTTVEAVERAMGIHGFTVTRKHDLQATLASKGFSIQPLVVMDVVMPERRKDMCKLHVYAEGDSVWVIAIRPTVIADGDGEVGAEVSKKIEKSLTALVDDVVA